jgi:hypothetical protein
VRWKRKRFDRVAPKVQTRYFLLQPSLPLNQATLVRGAFVLLARARPAHSSNQHLALRVMEKYAHSAMCIELSQTKPCLSSFKTGEPNSFVIR